MRVVRARIRSWVIAALLIQAASLGALLPRACCAAHEHAADHASPSCHTGERHETAPDQCALRGACTGPMSAMLALLSQVGVLPLPATTLADGGDAAIVLMFVLQPDRLHTPPDSPPPRG